MLWVRFPCRDHSSMVSDVGAHKPLQAFVFGLQLSKWLPTGYYLPASGGVGNIQWFAIYFLPTFLNPLIVSSARRVDQSITHVHQAMYPTVIILLVTLTRSRCDMLLTDQSKPPTSLPLTFALRTISDGGAHSTVQIAAVSEERGRGSFDSRLSAGSPVSVSHPPRAASRRESAYSSSTRGI